MKRIIKNLALTFVAVILVAGTATAQEEMTKKQREAEAARRAEIAAERASRRSEEAVRRAEMDHQRHMEMRMREKGGWYAPKRYSFITDSTGNFKVIASPDSTEIIKFRVPEIPDMDFDFQMPEIEGGRFRGMYFSDSKPGSSWNYSRHLAEATFSSDYSISADAEGSDVNLDISGGCAEGSISITVIAPDGSKLTEVIIDEQGSVNWRKNFNIEEGKWNKGNWVFKVKAEKATGHFNISLNSF